VCRSVGILTALCIFPRTDVMRQTLSPVGLLPSGLKIDHPSDSGIRSKEFSNLKLIKT